MEDRYYSKALQRYFPTRLDILLYAHDGRGLGHASRAITIGLALRRLYPQKKVLFISGCADSQMLIGPAPLDWIKLPAYQTILKEGVPAGQDGPAGFYKSVLGGLRSEILAAAIETLRPRCVLVDHNPAGKRKELLGALQKRASTDTRWVLGLRGVIGEDRFLWTEEAAKIVNQYYHQIVWYGDPSVLGEAPAQRIEGHFQQAPLVAGYVSRLQEIQPYLDIPPRQLAGTISIPWMSDRSQSLIHALQSALKDIGPTHGDWHLFVPQTEVGRLKRRFQNQAFCLVQPVGGQYLTSLLRSRVALIYGGYNSLIDVAAARTPAVVILRGTRDNEQVAHLTRLNRSRGAGLRIFTEPEVETQPLQEALTTLLESSSNPQFNLDINGAERTAQFLNSL